MTMNTNDAMQALKDYFGGQWSQIKYQMDGWKRFDEEKQLVAEITRVLASFRVSLDRFAEWEGDIKDWCQANFRFGHETTTDYLMRGYRAVKAQHELVQVPSDADEWPPL